MTKIEAQLKKSRERIAKLRKKQREQEERRKAKSKPKASRPRGRPRIDEKIIVRAIKLAETKTLRDVCFRLDISMQTLYNYGLTRQTIDAKAKNKK